MTSKLFWKAQSEASQGNVSSLNRFIISYNWKNICTSNGDLRYSGDNERYWDGKGKRQTVSVNNQPHLYGSEVTLSAFK